jgi:hypothetical protein
VNLRKDHYRIQRDVAGLFRLCTPAFISTCALTVDWDWFSSLCLHIPFIIEVNGMYLGFGQKNNTTFNNGSLGSRIDEERSELRYVMWIAEFSESSNLWTHLAPFGIPKGMPVWVSLNSQLQRFILLKLGCWRTFAGIYSMSAPLKCISRTCMFGSGLIMLSMPLLKGHLFSF